MALRRGASVTASLLEIDRDEVIARLRRAAGRLRRAAQVHHLLVQLVPETDEGDALEDQVRQLAASFNTVIIAQGLEFEEQSRRLESSVLGLERELEQFDARIPTTSFQQRFDRLQASTSALADYAALLGEHLGDGLARIDRVQFLLTRAIRSFTADEYLEPAGRVALLSGLLPPVRVDPDVRAAAIDSFEETAHRLDRFPSLELLLDSGLFDELGGFKVSLRDQLLDPEVMSALIELDAAISTSVGRLCEGLPEREEAFAAHLALVDERLERMFAQLRAEDAQLRERFDEWVARPRKQKPAAAPLQAIAPTQPRRPARRLAAMAIALAVALVIAIVRHQSGSHLRPLERADLALLSPMLAKGAVDPPVFLGEIDRVGWATLDLERRRETASRLAKALERRGWPIATVMLDDRVVMQLEQGQPLLVQ